MREMAEGGLRYEARRLWSARERERRETGMMNPGERGGSREEGCNHQAKIRRGDKASIIDSLPKRFTIPKR